jgi:hypothetical protein
MKKKITGVQAGRMPVPDLKKVMNSMIKGSCKP